MCGGYYDSKDNFKPKKQGLDSLEGPFRATEFGSLEDAKGNEIAVFSGTREASYVEQAKAAATQLNKAYGHHDVA